MRLPVCLVALGLFFWSWPNVAAAQTTTRDGVQALLRGDYQTAARILRPLAEDSPQPDPVAQFFMATLYASGNGVPRSDLKACGLYLSASTPANPLMNQALELVRTFQEQSVRASVQLCTPIRADDYGQLPSASFDLGPDHRITMDRSGATISYRGTQGQAHWDMGGAGWVFLPPQHVELIVSRPVTATRHFILFFVWWPRPPTARCGLWGGYCTKRSDRTFLPSRVRRGSRRSRHPNRRHRSMSKAWLAFV